MTLVTPMIGNVVTIELPYSEVCMHMRVAGTVRPVKILPDGAQILNDDMTPFSFPVTWGEAGIGRDGDGRPIVLREHYPRVTDDGRMVWACCESSIGPDCPHKTARHGE